MGQLSLCNLPQEKPLQREARSPQPEESLPSTNAQHSQKQPKKKMKERRDSLPASRRERAKPTSAPRVAFLRRLLRVLAFSSNPQRRRAFHVTALPVCPPSYSAQACLGALNCHRAIKARPSEGQGGGPWGLWGEPAGARDSWASAQPFPASEPQVSDDLELEATPGGSA